MNNRTASSLATPQLGFDFLSAMTPATAINKLGSTSISEFDLSNPSGIAAGEALSRLVVDDRVLNMGMTTWRALLDRAISLGHTELYPTDEGRMGLRTPGMRFGPINRMPELGPEYVHRSVFSQRLSKALGAGQAVKSSRVAIDEEIKLDLSVTEEMFLIGFYKNRKTVGSVAAALDSFPISAQYCQSEALKGHLQAELAAAVPEVSAAAFTRAMQGAAAQILKILGSK